jgi:glucose dehydrogenase
VTDVTGSGVLTTATNLVFAGGREGYFFALDALTGTVLWKEMVGGQHSFSTPVDAERRVSRPPSDQRNGQTT